MQEHAPQIFVSPLADAQQPGFTASRMLARNQPQPGGEIPAFAESDAVADGCNERRRDQRSKAGNFHQPATCIVLPGDLLQLYVGRFDPRFKLFPLVPQLKNQ